MGQISTQPRQQIPFTLKRWRPFSLLVDFKRPDKTAIDLTGATLRLVLAEPEYKGSAVLVSSLAAQTNAPAGLVQFDIQGDELTMEAGQYILSATLESAEGFESTVFEGEVEVTHNPDPVVPEDHTGVVAPLGLTVTMRSANRVSVRINHHPDSVLLAYTQQALAAQLEAEEAAAAAAQILQDILDYIANFTQGDKGDAGPMGPMGPRGADGDPGIELVHHGSDANYARPAGAGTVYWIGTADPLNALSHDIRSEA